MGRNWFEALDVAADGVFIIDKEQRIVFWNEAAGKIVGHHGQEIVGSFCYAILRGYGERGQPICRENCCRAAAAARYQPVNSFDLAVRTKSNDVCWLNMSVLTWPDNGTGNGGKILHIFRDVTLRRQREALLDQVLEAVNSLQSEEQIDTDPSPSKDDLKWDLTDREYQVLSLLAEGLGTRDIARTLFISSSTTRNHIRNILQKLNVHSRLEAVVLAFKSGLVAKS